MEEARREAVDLVSRNLKKMGHIDTFELRKLNLRLEENFEMGLLQFRASICKIIMEQEKSKCATIHMNECKDKLFSTSDKLFEMNIREMLQDNTESSEHAINFFTTYSNMYIAAEFVSKLENLNKYLNKIDEALEIGLTPEKDGQELNYALIYKMLNVSHEIRNRVMLQAKAKSRNLELTEKTFEDFFAGLNALTAEFEARYCSMGRKVVEFLLKGDCTLAKNLLEITDNVHKEESVYKNEAHISLRDKDCSPKYELKAALIEKLKTLVINYINNLKIQYGLDTMMLVIKSYETITTFLEIPEASAPEDSDVKNLIHMLAHTMHEKLHKIVSSVYQIDNLSFERILEYFEKLYKYKKAIEYAFSEDISTKNILMDQVNHDQMTICELYTKYELEHMSKEYNYDVKSKIVISEDCIKIENGIGRAVIDSFCQLEKNLKSVIPFLIIYAMSAYCKTLNMFFSDLSEVKTKILYMTIDVRSVSIPVSVEPVLFTLSQEVHTVLIYVQEKLITSINNQLPIIKDNKETSKILELKKEVVNIAAKLKKLYYDSAESACSVISKRVSRIKDILFTTKWYESDVLNFAICILLDSLSHIDKNNNSDFWLLIMHRIFKDTINVYIGSLKTKKFILRKNFDAIIKKDAKKIEDALRDLEITKPELYTAPMHALADIVTSSKQTAILNACKALHDSYDDCTIALLRRILEESPNCKEEIIDNILSNLEDKSGSTE